MMPVKARCHHWKVTLTECYHFYSHRACERDHGTRYESNKNYNRIYRLARYSKQNVWCKKWLCGQLCDYQSIWRNAKYNLCCSKWRWFFSQVRVFLFFESSLLPHIMFCWGDPLKWNLSDYRRFVCYYSKMHFNQVWRTWKPFDLDQTRNIDANWIRITLSIRNHVKNRSDHWCRTAIVVSAFFSPGYNVRQNLKSFI